MNYPLAKLNKEGTLFQATISSYSDEYAQRMCDLYLSAVFEENKHGTVEKYYRLHAQKPHSIEDALAYDIFCPGCRLNKLKQVGRMIDAYELGLYVCPSCGK